MPRGSASRNAFIYATRGAFVVHRVTPPHDAVFITHEEGARHRVHMGVEPHHRRPAALCVLGTAPRDKFYIYAVG